MYINWCNHLLLWDFCMILIWSYLASNLVPIYSSIWPFDFQARFSKVLRICIHEIILLEIQKTIWGTWIPLPSSMTLHQHLEFIMWMMLKLVFELESHAQEVSLGASSLLFQFQSMFTSLECKACYYTISLCTMYQKGWLIILWMTTFDLAWRGWYVSMFYFCDTVRLVT
jgi:hypothetical protein